MKWGRLLVLMLLTLLLVALAACSSGESDETGTTDESTNKSGEAAAGGVLRVAMSAQPPTLDQPTSTAVVVKDTGRLMFETLLTTDSKYQVVPMLAESFDVSDDSKDYVFHLRKGVKFHNGKEMKADDVVASMERWVEKSSVTGTIFDGATFKAEDDYTVTLALAKPSALTLDTLASAKMAAAIMPKEVIEEAGTEGVKDYIGTGPFEFVEWKRDQYIHFTKYDGYQPVEGEADGLAGKKEALVDDIYFDIVPDPSTRLAGLQTGQYDFAYSIPADNYDQLQNTPNIKPVLDNYGELVIFHNEQEGIASDFKIRQAVNTALDPEEIMLGTFTNEDLFWFDSSYMTNTIASWASDAGSKHYMVHDPEKTKEILNEIGYNDEKLKIMTTRDYPHLYNASVVIQEQLKEAGFNAELVIFDWPTFMDKQENDLGAWDILITGSSTVSTPTQLLYISSTFAGGIADPKTKELLAEIEVSASQEEAKQLWDELQGYAWEEHLPVSIIGGYYGLYGATDKVEGITTFSGPIYWNTSVKK